MDAGELKDASHDGSKVSSRSDEEVDALAASFAFASVPVTAAVEDETIDV